MFQTVTKLSTRLIAFVLTLAMLFSLAACGGNQSPNTDEKTDEQLQGQINELIADLENSDASVEDLDMPQTGEKGFQTDPSVYGTEGEMKVPFDVAYPELIENGTVVFSDESLLIKLKNNTLTDGLKAAGVAALELIVPMDECGWYEAKLLAGTDAKAALAAVRALPDVLLAEYNYTIRTAAIDDYKHFDKEKEEEFKKNGHNKDQWHFHYCGIPDGYEEMDTAGGLPSVVVAVIDTGVDYDHEDLANSMWVNTAEKPDNGKDDDGNGYIDDYYGWNAVTGKGSADDDNGHGTHVAGIIAAQNNDVGVVGIAYGAKIMPVKAAMASGTLLQADIAEAIIYAYENGAEVINMSFGGTACSIAVQDALAVAYTRCVLVASAGNDGENNEPTPTDDIALPNYPGALSYVLGVMSVDQNGVESSFSNWDVYPFNGVEYELYAPGEQIMSTLPNDQYGFLSGTSMAAPMVSAMAAILRSEFADRDTYPTRFIYGQLSSTSEYYATCLDPKAHGKHNIPQIVNLEAALTKLPKPELGVQDYAIFDDPAFSDKNNGDGVIDAGETIALGLTLRNRWGQSKDTMVTVHSKNNGIPDPYITFLKDTVNYGSIGTYATGDCGRIYTDELFTGWEDPFMLKIAEDCPNDYIFNLFVEITCGNGLDPEDKESYAFNSLDPTFQLTVRSGALLPSVIDEDMVLTSDKLYIIPNSTVIEEGVTVRVEPGTHIQFWSDDAADPYADSYIAYLRVEGSFLVDGTKEDPVMIYPSQLMDKYNVELSASNTGSIRLRYADVTNLFAGGNNAGNYNSISVAERCTFRNNYGDRIYYRYLSGGVVKLDWSYYGNIATFGLLKDCVFYKLGLDGGQRFYGDAQRCIFVDCGIDYSDASLRDCVLLGNNFVDQTRPNDYTGSSMTLGSLKAFPKEALSVWYRPETGHAYLCFAECDLYSVNGASGAWHEYDSAILLTQGYQYAVAEDEQEFTWLRSKLVKDSYSGYYLGISYDPDQGCYTWADGTPVQDFTGFSALSPEMDFDMTPSLHYDGTWSPYYSGKTYRYTVFELPGEVLPTDIAFREYETVLDLQTTYQIAPVSQPAQLPAQMFLYESSDEKVLTVDETGLVTPVGKGTADVTVYSLDKAVRNHITFTVKDYVPLESLAFEKGTLAVAVGETVPAGCVLTPANTTRRNVIYASSDASVLAVDIAGNLTGLSSGTVTLAATCEGLTDQITVRVYRKATALTLEKSATSVALSAGTMALPKVTASEGAEVDLFWTSSDTDVAQIQDGAVILKKAGTTALIVTDRNSGISAEQVLFVKAATPSPVIKLDAEGGYYRALTADGKLYCWGSGICTTPLCILENVKDFDATTGSILVLFNDGVVKRYYNSSTQASYNYLSLYHTYNQFVGADPVGVAYNGDSYYVYTQSGLCYAWGDNDKGQLGLGHTADVGTPSLVNLDAKIVQVETSGVMTGFLTDTGDLYVAGGSNLLAATPKRVAQNVTNLDYNETIVFLSDDTWYYISDDSIAPYRVRSQIVADRIAAYVNQGAIMSQGDALSTYTSNNGWKQIPGKWDISALAVRSSTYWFATTDGLLYGMGPNNSGQLGGAIVGSADVPVAIPLESLPGDVLALTGSNLADTRLTTDALTLTFNKSIATAGGVSLHANGVQTPMTFTAKHNTLTVTKASGFQTGVTYTLKLAADALTGTAGTKLAQDVTLTFTYVPGGEVDQETGAVTAPVVHETVTDTSIDRGIPTRESVHTDIMQTQEEDQIHPDFYGNAILNRISTDTEVTHWLRPLAPNSAGEEVPLGGNYWGATNETAIELQMIDYRDFISYGKFNYAPYLTTAPENTFPFVTSVTVLDKEGNVIKANESVGHEEITIRVTFNRDMDTSIPLQVLFGSAYPYADYAVTNGGYVDARTWEGKYFVSTVIGNGYQYFTIRNGCSATDDLELQPDVNRFMFHIDTTAAQALIMQGYATETGIQLRWTQDDFDTLMGYNVYRSTAKDGFYTRLNQTVIPADTMEFFDDTVEPGVQYYYNFTVVKTDLSESTPSGKITIMSMDTMAPNIYHSPVYTAFTGSNLILSATVTDNLNITYARVYYRMVGTSTWSVAVMNNLNDKYSAIIPAGAISLEGLEYYIEAFDGISYTYKGSADAPYTVTVQEAVPVRAKGDVNGDGRVSVLDALMLLQCLNDDLNLSAEEFARADLNGDGLLSAVEALRILQYINGKVTTLDM